MKLSMQRGLKVTGPVIEEKSGRPLVGVTLYANALGKEP
ncbi:MAG: hypothetical protein JWM16_2274 [Verrucomicrobiales bacterium]|nr:hypothetical protein [Verrucomicrobiales bacterium]